MIYLFIARKMLKFHVISCVEVKDFFNLHSFWFFREFVNVCDAEFNMTQEIWYKALPVLVTNGIHSKIFWTQRIHKLYTVIYKNKIWWINIFFIYMKPKLFFTWITKKYKQYNHKSNCLKITLFSITMILPINYINIEFWGFTRVQ